jgi:hypothetical protein
MSDRPDIDNKMASYLHEMLKVYVGSVQSTLRPFSSRGREILRELEGSLEEWDRQLESLSPADLEENILREIQGQVGTLHGEWAQRFDRNAAALAAIAEIPAKEHQRDVLEALLDVGESLSDRCFILLVKRGQATGWGGRGYEPSFLADSLRRYDDAVDDDRVLNSLVKNKSVAIWTREQLPPGEPCLDIPGFAKPARFLIAPLCLLGTVTAVLFLDGDCLRLDPEEASRITGLAMTTAALWLENMALRHSLGIEAGGAEAATAAPVLESAPAFADRAEGELLDRLAKARVEAVEESLPVKEEPRFEEELLSPGIVEEPILPEAPVIPVEEEVEALSSVAVEAPQRMEPPTPPISLLDEVFEMPAGRPATLEEIPAPPELEEVQEEILIAEEAEPPTSPDKALAEMPEMPVEEIVLEEAYDPGQTVLEDMSVLTPEAPLPVQIGMEGFSAANEEIVLEEKPLEELVLEENPVMEEYKAPMLPPPPPLKEPAKPVEEEKGPPWATAEEEKLHNDARRFARLLVSEIKLYNEDSVTEGRIEKDLYRRLRKDIDRSREMYDKRVAPVVARKIDYFREELIRILGEGDKAKMGPDFPGSVLLS